MSRRSNIRRDGGGGGGGSGGGSGLSYQSILGANLVAMWHSQLGVGLVGGELDTWTDQIGGRVLQASGAGNRLAYATDGSNFKTKPVVQTDSTTPRVLRNTFAAFTGAAGRPWVYSVHRLRNLAGDGSDFTTICAIGTNGFGDAMTLYRRASANTVPLANSRSAYVNSVNPDIQSTTVADTNQTHMEVGYDAATSNTLYFSINGAAFQFGGAVTQNAQTTVSIGTAIFASTEKSDSNHGLFLVCAAQPSVAQRAAVRALAIADFG